MTQETKPVKTWGGFNLTIIKVNLIHYERIEILQQRLRPLTSYCYLVQKTYYHNHLTAPRPWTPSFLDFPARTSTPACVSLSFLVQQLNDHQALNEISFLIILSICEGNHLLDLTRDSHTQQIEPPQKRGQDFPFIPRAKYKTLHVI